MSGLGEAGSVAVLAAMRQEIRPVVRRLDLRPATIGGHPARAGVVSGRRVVAVVTSMGTRAAASVTESVLDDGGFDHVVVVGICGGIAPELPIGSLVVPVETVVEETGRVCRPSPPASHEPAGRLLTTDTLHADPAEVRALRKRGFVAVDMETGAIGAVCEDRGVPWSVFRAVSDRAGDPAIDPALLALSRPDGTPVPAAVARHVLRHPTRIPKLASLGRGMRAAVGVSTDALVGALA